MVIAEFLRRSVGSGVEVRFVASLPGVVIPPAMRRDDITIRLQPGNHRALEVTDSDIRVSVTFAGVLTRIVIPWVTVVSVLVDRRRGYVWRPGAGMVAVGMADLRLIQGGKA